MGVTDRVQKTTASDPPRTFFYGVNGIGKTNLASEYPNAVFIQTEEGDAYDPDGCQIELDVFRDIKCLGEVYEIINDLCNDPHDFKTLVIDTIDTFEPLVNRHVCDRKGWETIESPGFGKGYEQSVYEWRRVMKALNHLRKFRQMNIIFLSQADIVKHEPPGGEKHNTYIPRLNYRALDVVYSDCDICMFGDFATEETVTEEGFGRKSTKTKGNGTRMLHFEKRPAFLAKNRYGLPPSTFLTPGRTIKFLLERMPISRSADDVQQVFKKTTSETQTSKVE